MNEQAKRDDKFPELDGLQQLDPEPTEVQRHLNLPNALHLYLRDAILSREEIAETREQLEQATISMKSVESPPPGSRVR